MCSSRSSGKIPPSHRADALRAIQKKRTCRHRQVRFFHKARGNPLLSCIAGTLLCAKSRTICLSKGDIPVFRFFPAAHFSLPDRKHRKLLYSPENSAILFAFSAILRIFSCCFIVNIVLRAIYLIPLCFLPAISCFSFRDTLSFANAICKRQADKRPSNFSACYNCFFVRIPLK